MLGGWRYHCRDEHTTPFVVEMLQSRKTSRQRKRQSHNSKINRSAKYRISANVPGAEASGPHGRLALSLFFFFTLLESPIPDFLFLCAASTPWLHFISTTSKYQLSISKMLEVRHHPMKQKSSTTMSAVFRKSTEGRLPIDGTWQLWARSKSCECVSPRGWGASCANRLQRNFSFITMLGFASTCVASWEGILTYDASCCFHTMSQHLTMADTSDLS